MRIKIVDFVSERAFYFDNYVADTFAFVGDNIEFDLLIDGVPVTQSFPCFVPANGTGYLVIEEKQENDDGYGETEDIGALFVAQVLKEKHVDLRTQELISQGFTYATKTFSFSIPAQLNWTSLATANLYNLLSFPLRVSAVVGYYDLVDQTDLVTFCTTAVGTAMYHLDAGRALNVSIYACTTLAELDAIVDNR